LVAMRTSKATPLPRRFSMPRWCFESDFILKTSG
jgi:hypothetical protein